MISNNNRFFISEAIHFFSFNIVKKGSDLLIEEFPNYKDIINTKEKIEKI